MPPSAGTSRADAVITGRGYEIVRMLTDESIPVMGHLGFVPRKSRSARDGDWRPQTKITRDNPR